MAGSINLTSLSTELKQRIEDGGKEMIFDLVSQGIPDYFGKITGVNGTTPLVSVLTGEVLQPGAKNSFNSKGDTSIKSRLCQIRPVKFDKTFLPADIYALYNTYMAQVKGGKIDPSKLPFEAEIMKSLAIRIEKDKLNAIWNGTYNASGTDTVDVMDGIRTLVTAAVASTDIPAGNVYAGAAITASNAFEQIKGVSSLVLASKEYASAPMDMMVSSQVYDFYCQDYIATRGTSMTVNEFGQAVVEGTNHRLRPVSWLNGSSRVILTPTSENLFLCVDDENPLANIQVESALRNIHVFGDLYFGVQFARTDIVWVNNYSGIA